MAFHQPTAPQWAQNVARSTQDEPTARQSPTANHSNQQLDESQTWVLFAPPTEPSTTSYLTETEPSLDTPGRSQISDLGSLNAEERPEEVTHRAQDLPSASVAEHESAVDDGELDSLDGHLPDFRSFPGIQSIIQQNNHHGTPVLPSHDGLGSFRLDQPALGANAQNHIYQFERFNPRRLRRRRESFDRVAVEMDEEHAHEDEKRRRIEAWRLEQSQALLDEVQRETRRRRKSLASLQRAHVASPSESRGSQLKDTESDHTSWHDEEAVDQPDEPEGFLARLTCTIVKDLLGLDDKMLSILLGESLPVEEEEEDLSSTPRASQLMGPTSDESSWQLRLIERVSQELGLLVNRFSHHPGAFSTYDRMQQMPLEYAGLPVIPESRAAQSEVQDTSANDEHSRASSPEFRPTVQHQTSQPMDIPGHHDTSTTDTGDGDATLNNNTFSKDEWERDLDVKLVFRYLRSRFLTRSGSSSTSGGIHATSSGVQDAAAKVARVRQHHPLITRSRPMERRAFRVASPGSPIAMRLPSSCASQSTRRSARRSSGSSRHYWDLGGSLGTGSAIASNVGPMGSWGEV